MNVHQCLSCGLDYIGKPGLKKCIVCKQNDLLGFQPMKRKNVQSTLKAQIYEKPVPK